MESFSSHFLGFFFFFLLASVCQGQLDSNFYSTSCPNLQTIVSSGMQTAISSDTRIAASILRLHFHDCFVNGCDGSVLLDDTSTFTGEKTARPNQNSLRGFDVIDTIKSSVETQCNATVSCADILALAALEGVKQVNGPTWTLGLGRRDARTASLATANSDLPPPTANLSALLNFFSNKNLDATDLTALSGAHTIGQARCVTFRGHIYNDTDIDSTFAATRQANCPFSTDGTGDNNLAPLDVSTQDSFDNGYFQNLVANQGLLHSDQELFNGGSQDSLVSSYSTSQSTFFSDFATAMTKMSNLSPLTGSNGEIRLNCRVVN